MFGLPLARALVPASHSHKESSYESFLRALATWVAQCPAGYVCPETLDIVALQHGERRWQAAL
jgi:hypothetical protein